MLRVGLALGGMISGFGMFNALVMSYSRLPLAMAQDGMLPKVFGKLHPRSRAPWVTILVCAAGWAMCLGLGFERLIIIDILLYGVSLGLEFVALIVLRIREPELPRPFRVPGGMFGAVAVGVAPMLLLGFSVVRGRERASAGDERLHLRHAADRGGGLGLFRECNPQACRLERTDGEARAGSIRILCHGFARILTDLSVRIRVSPWPSSFGVK